MMIGELTHNYIQKFNAENKWRKRGISMIPLKYGISYSGPRGTLDQGGAYVVAYSNDGSVLVSHGGVEMGQGIQNFFCHSVTEIILFRVTTHIDKRKNGYTFSA